MSRPQPQSNVDLPDRNDVPLPSELVRSVITLVVFIHLFILFSGAFARTRVSSDLFRGLHNVPGFTKYLGLLHMGSYSFHLTYNGTLDQDYNCEVVLDWRDGLAVDSDEYRALRKLKLYDEQGIFPPTRRRRYQMLAYSVAANVGADSAVESQLPLAISRRLLAEQNITQSTPPRRHRFRSRRQSIRVPEFFRPEQPQVEDPYDESYYSDVYQADVTFFQGQANINKVSQSRETAPVDRPAGQNRSSTGRPPSGRTDQPPINFNPLPNVNRN